MFAEEHPDWPLLRNDGRPQHLGDLLQIMDPANPSLQAHWLSVYTRASQAIGFDGFHLDPYGYPRCPLDATGHHRSMAQSHRAFVDRVRAALPSPVLSFNQVNGVPFGQQVPPRPAFRYVWSPNDGWRHFEGLMARSAAPSPRSGGVLALYPPVWNEDRRGRVAHRVAHRRSGNDSRVRPAGPR